jgi:hypothetical protein
MNATDFTVKTSTVVSVQPTSSGTEIWAQQDDGREASYQVNDDSFRAREGHKLTTILYGRHPVAIRNDTTMTKIQLLNGWDLLGSGPQVKSRSVGFWIGWFVLIMGPGLMAIGVVTMIFEHFFGGNAVLNALGAVIGVMMYLGMVFGIPYWCIVHPRIGRARHNRRVKEADAAIAQIFTPL